MGSAKPELSLDRAIQAFVAARAISPSTARGQGAQGVVGAMKGALIGLRLDEFSVGTENEFTQALDRSTEAVEQALPGAGRSWGLARKGLNIFLRDCFYDRVLAESHGLLSSERWFEIPLDALVAKALRKELGNEIPIWRSVRGLKPDESRELEAGTSQLAQEWGISRVHLDSFLWVRERDALPSRRG